MTGLLGAAGTVRGRDRHSPSARDAATSGRGDRRVVVWRDRLLRGSETFIRNQSDAVTAHACVPIGLRSHPSPLARDDDRILYGSAVSDRIAESLLHLTGRSRRLARVLRQQQPQLIHAHFLPDAWLVARTATRLGIPFIVTVHGFDVTQQMGGRGLTGRLARRRARFVFGRAARVVAVSEFIRSKAIALGAPEHRVVVHHIGIPIPESVDPCEKIWDVAFVGRFVEKKGVLDLIEALGGLPHGLRPRCVFIGEGPLLDQARRHVQRTGVDATFMGAQAPEIVQRTLAQARVFAAPSKTSRDGDSEGFGMVFLEAAAVGVPAVSTLHGGVPEAVVDGVTGLLSAEGDVSALAVNIARLLMSRELRQELGSAARQRVVRDFDVRRQTGKLEDIYDEVAAESAG